MKMSYAPTFHTQPKSDLITITDGEPQVDQKYYLIPFWIRDIFRDNGLHYKDMIESEIVSKYVSLQDITLADNTCWVISSMIDFFNSKSLTVFCKFLSSKFSNIRSEPFNCIFSIF